MSQAITTVYLPPTNTKGSRIKAICDARTIIRAYGYEVSAERDHARVAMELAKLMNWTGVYVAGVACLTKGSRGYVYTRIPDLYLGDAFVPHDANENRTFHVVGVTDRDGR